MNYSLYTFEKKNYETLLENTEAILENHDITREEDLVLYFFYLAKHEHPIFKQIISVLGVERIKKLTKPETIKTIRQIIQNKEKKWVPPPVIAINRSQRTTEFKMWCIKHRLTQYLDDSLFPEEPSHDNSLKDSWFTEL